MTRPLRKEIPRIALTPAEAAASIGISEGTFNEYVRPHLKPCRIGSKVLFSVAELKQYVAEHSESVLA
jgi:excisionase family DNA binding protein